MATQLSMQYTEMETAIKNLKTESGNFKTASDNMSKQVKTLCDNWKADASSVYFADYTKLTKNFNKTKEVVDKLIESTEKYIADMKKVDSAYSKSKVE